jgi:hypothetical protein
MKPGFVIGNGRSRLALNLEDLKKHGRIYGCNALYRDFTPDVLIATDPGITAEIEDSGYALKNAFYTRQPRAELGSQLILHHFGFSSGPIAVKYAAEAAHAVIYLVGFDLQGQEGRQNNVYSSTDNYRRSEDKETYYGNWVKQLAQIFREHRDQRFVRLTNDDGIVPVQWLQCNNHSSQLISDFMPNINSKPWQRSKE